MTLTNIKSKPLKWSTGNAKLSKRIIHFSLPSGHTCPAAHLCLSKADMTKGTITDGKYTEYRCYAASQEAAYPALRNLRWDNFLELKNLSRRKMFHRLKSSLSPAHQQYMLDHGQRPIIRAHVGGDFFNERYFLAWMDLAHEYHPTQFYAYTKRLDLWVKHKQIIPDNFELNASRGGKHDKLIDLHNLKCATVVYSHEQAAHLNLELDHDDSHAYKPTGSFAQLIHGTQPKGSSASKAISKLRTKYGCVGHKASTKTV